MRVLKTSWFRKFAAKERISDAALCEAVSRVEVGLVDADFGSGLLKQRIARPGAGRSGGYRTILIFRSGERAVFVFGFAKSDRANLTAQEVKWTRSFGQFGSLSKVDSGLNHAASQMSC